MTYQSPKPGDLQANEVSGLMIMGVAGGAVIPPLMGVIADAMGQTGGLALLLVAMVYLLITAFGLKPQEK